jgi:hypothetical protein
MGSAAERETEVSSPCGPFAVLFRWRWHFAPKARRELIALVQVEGIPDAEQKRLENMILDEDDAIFDIMADYERLGYKCTPGWIRK